jgi:hypothetical protein
LKSGRIAIDTLFGTGRIAEIIQHLKREYGVETPRHLTAKQKLEALCQALQLTHEQMDEIIALNPQVLRTVKGHVFEVIFQYLLSKSGYEVTEVGGDVDVDCIVNNRTLQLKAPYEAGTNADIVQYKTHKTHGPKSEEESLEYYHHLDTFADYLVGLVSYSPFKVIFLSKSELPTHPHDTNRIASPFAIKWKNHPGLNAFGRIGVEKIDLSPLLYLHSATEKELLPKSAQALQVKTDIILDAILSEKNFRIWDMSIRGFARERYFRDFLTLHEVKQLNPSQCRENRSDKADLVLVNKTTSKYNFLQVKGVSLRNCSFKGAQSIVAIETQLTRGRVNDHPTQSRLYMKNDFDLLIIGIDPCLHQIYAREIAKNVGLEWEFYSVPTADLELYPRFNNRLKSVQRFRYTQLQQYLVNDEWLGIWQKELRLL